MSTKNINRKELVLNAMDNKPVERVLAGVWFHFLADEIHSDAFAQPELTEELLAGELKYIEKSQPDFVKIMTDGFFPYTNESFIKAKTAADLKNVKPLAKDDKWFTYQVEYAKKITDKYGDEFSAYVSEIFRVAYSAVPRGQYEAAISVGISGWQAFWHIMLPQAAVLALPNFGNSVINLLKEGALAYTIGLIDMIGKGNLIIAKNFGAYGIEIYLACMLVY